MTVLDFNGYGIGTSVQGGPPPWYECSVPQPRYNQRPYNVKFSALPTHSAFSRMKPKKQPAPEKRLLTKKVRRAPAKDARPMTWQPPTAGPKEEAKQDEAKQDEVEEDEAKQDEVEEEGEILEQEEGNEEEEGEVFDTLPMEKASKVRDILYRLDYEVFKRKKRDILESLATVMSRVQRVRTNNHAGQCSM